MAFANTNGLMQPWRDHKGKPKNPHIGDKEYAKLMFEKRKKARENMEKYNSEGGNVVADFDEYFGGYYTE
jgi:hypothetical protein